MPSESASRSRNENLCQCQNYCITLSIWTLVAILMSFIKETLQSSHVPSFPFSFSPSCTKKKGVEFGQNCNLEIPVHKCKHTKQNYLDFDVF